MKSILLIVGVFFASSLTYSQYCLSGGPTSIIDSNVESVSINGDGGSSINHIGCPGVIGVEDLTVQEVTLGSSSSYTMNVQFGTCGNNYSGAGEAWIDYNGNQIFEATESIGQWQGSIPTAMSVFNFTVPSSVFNGTVRMRIIQEENGTLPLNPCATFSWGSVMDFSVNFGPGIDCSGYLGDDESDAIEVNTFPYLHSHATNVCYTNQSTAYVSPDVYYLLKIPVGTYGLKASLCGSSFDTYMTVYDTDGNLLAINDDYQSCGQNSQVSFNTQSEDSVYLVVEGWGTESGAYELLIASETVSLQDDELSKVSIFPNPSESYIQISGADNSNISIVSISGKTVYSNKNFNNQNIDISTFAKGMYLVIIRKDNKSQTIKLQVL